MLEAGADAALCKPCRESDLLEEIRKQLDLQYTYADAPASDRSSAPPSLAPRATARMLPLDLREALQKAARVADYDEILALIGRLSDGQGELGEDIRRRVEAYDYDGVERLLREG
jgi:DNA-binding response OmpR family regulator